ncbi:MAG: YIP1 family protein [Gemmobacter sp.]
MDLSLPALLMQVRDTLREPRAGARRILALRLAAPVAWSAVVLLACVSTLLAYLSFYLSPAETRAFFAQAMAVPLRTAFLQLFVWVAGTFAIYRLGRARGGRGTMDEAVALVAWLQFVMLVLQSVTLVAQLLVPPLAGLLALAEVAVFFWLLVSFVAELHGFRSLAATFAGVLAGLFALFLVLAVILAPIMGPMTVGG